MFFEQGAGHNIALRALPDANNSDFQISAFMV